jgi:uncharacterized protein (TIGR03083 family)
MRDDFLRGARLVLAALSRPEVAQAWDAPSVLEEQTVGALAGHLARGGVWVVGDYLDLDPASEATHPTVEAYYAWVATLDETAHQGIRERGAALAEEGADAIVARLDERIARLDERLAAEPFDRILPVAGGTMALDDFLATRLVEQVVHLDDLGRSVGIDCGAPDDLVAKVAHTGLGVALLRHGPTHVLRLLYRDAPPGVLPVLGPSVNSS